MAQQIHPTLFRLGWTKQSDQLWFSFQKSHYGTLFVQDLLWRQGLEGAFLQIGFWISDLFLQRNAQGLFITLQIFPFQNYSHTVPSSKHKLNSTALTPSLTSPIDKIPSWKVYNLCFHFQKIIEQKTQQPVFFRIEWVPNPSGTATFMAKHIRSLIEKKVSIKKALDTVITSRQILPSHKVSFVLPDHSYGSLNWWVWIALNSLRTSFQQNGLKILEKKRGLSEIYFPFLKKIYPSLFWGFRLYFPQSLGRSSWNRLRFQSWYWKKTGSSFLKIHQIQEKNFSSFLFSKRKRILTSFSGKSLPLFKKESWNIEFQPHSRVSLPKVYRSYYLTQYWVGYLKIILQFQLWKKESFQMAPSKNLKGGDLAFQQSVERYPLWGELSMSLLHWGDFILSSQFQIRQGRFCQYRLSGRLNGVDMAQTLQGQQGSFQDPYALQMEQIGIQTPWGIYGLSIFST